MSIEDTLALLSKPGVQLQSITVTVSSPGLQNFDVRTTGPVGMYALSQWLAAALPEPGLAPSEPPIATGPAASALPWRTSLPGISTRLYNILTYARLPDGRAPVSLGDVVALGGAGLRKVRNCGSTSVNEARELLAKRGLTLSYG